MKRCCILLLSTTLAFFASGVEVSVGTYVCNPGTAVRVPIALDSAKGLVGVSITLAYDPQVVVCSRIEPGGLETVFDDEFLSANEESGVGSACMFKLGENIAEDIGGIVATFVFLARNGTAGQFSDITVTKVELLEESGVRDATVNNQIATINGMIRVVAPDAAVARMEGTQTIIADTRLGSLALSDGDGIKASDVGTPIIVVGEVITSSAVATIPVAEPDHGWATATYTLLTTPTAGLSFAIATNAIERLVVTETRANGISTYTLSVLAVNGLAVVSDEPLDAVLQTYVRGCVGRHEGLNTVLVKGGAEAVSYACAFGIRPTLSFSGSEAIAEYLMPTVRVTAFNPANGTIDAVVEPGHGNSISGSGKVTGVIEVIGSSTLGERMVSVENVEIDLSGYFNAETAGEVRCTANFGARHFFKVMISDKE